MGDKNKGETSATGVPNLDKGAWKPGQSGNPAGRPMGAKTGLRARLVQALDRAPDDDVLKVLEAKGIKLNDGDCAEVIALALTRKAQKGDIQAGKLIAEQTEVPFKQEYEHSGPGGGPVTVNYIIQPVKPMELEDVSGD